MSQDRALSQRHHGGKYSQGETYSGTIRPLPPGHGAGAGPRQEISAVKLNQRSRPEAKFRKSEKSNWVHRAGYDTDCARHRLAAEVGFLLPQFGLKSHINPSSLLEISLHVRRIMHFSGLWGFEFSL